MQENAKRNNRLHLGCRALIAYAPQADSSGELHKPNSYLLERCLTLLAQFAAIVKSCSDVFYIPNDCSGVANTKDVIFTAN